MVERSPDKLAPRQVHSLLILPNLRLRRGPSGEVEPPLARFFGNLLVVLALEVAQKCVHGRAQLRMRALFGLHFSELNYICKFWASSFPVF